MYTQRGGTLIQFVMSDDRPCDLRQFVSFQNCICENQQVPKSAAIRVPNETAASHTDPPWLYHATEHVRRAFCMVCAHHMPMDALSPSSLRRCGFTNTMPIPFSTAPKCLLQFVAFFFHLLDSVTVVSISQSSRGHCSSLIRHLLEHFIPSTRC